MRDIAGKRILILGGMRIHEKIINNVQKRGGKAIVIDYYDDFQNSPSKAIADEHYVVSTTNVDDVLKLIKEKKIDGVLMGYADSILPYFAEICERSGLPCYGTKEQFITLTNKSKYKRLLEKYEIPVVDDYLLCENFTENDTKNIKYPVLVKPSDGSGSRGVRICNNYEELKAGYKYALEWSKCREVVVEKYISGDEVVSFWVFQKGEAYLTALGNWHKKRFYKNVNAMGVAYTYPSTYLSEYERSIAPKAKKMFEDIGIKEGCLFMQCLIDEGIAKCYDIGFRLTGSMENEILKQVSGFDPLEMMVDYALLGDSGNSIRELIDPHFNNKYGWNISFLMKPGKLSRIEGYEDILKAKGVINATLAHGIGDEIKLSEKGQLKQIVLRVLGYSNSKKEIAEDMDRVYKLFHIYGENGEDLLMPSVDYKECLNLVEDK